MIAGPIPDKAAPIIMIIHFNKFGIGISAIIIEPIKMKIKCPSPLTNIDFRYPNFLMR